MRGSLNNNYLESISLSLTQVSLIRKLGEYRGQQELFTHQKPEVLETLRCSAIIESSESSNRIEGIVASRKRIEGIVLRDSAPKNRSETEIAGYKKALDLIHESALDMPITGNVILQLHKMLYAFHPYDGGCWKMVDNDIVEKDQSGNIVNIRFKPVSAVETHVAIEELVSRYNECIDINQIEPLLIIPLFILDFLCIHPFSDGNGRAARLLTLLLLYKHGYNVGRYISIERIVEDTKASYYSTLPNASRGWHEGNHSSLDWIEYFWGILLRSHREFEERVEAVEHTPKISKRDLILSAIDNMPEVFAVGDILEDVPSASREMIKVVINELKNEKKLQSIGKGRVARIKKCNP